jgi:dolichol kinase
VTAASGAARRPLSPRAYRSEVRRKLIHAATVCVPLGVWYLGRPAGLFLLGVGVVTALSIEWARMANRGCRHRFLRRTRRLLRRHERRRITGATYIAVGYFLALLVFPLPVAVAAMLYAAIGDSAAALVGRRWGRHRWANGKSAEGTAAAFLANLAVGIAVPGIPAVAALLGAAIAAFIEVAPLPFDDNLRVTLVGGTALWLAVSTVAIL